MPEPCVKAQLRYVHLAPKLATSQKPAVIPAPEEGSDVHNLMSQLVKYKENMDAAGVRDVIVKPCVRSISIAS